MRKNTQGTTKQRREYKRMNRSVINKAVKEYLKKGGKIKKIESNYEKFMSLSYIGQADLFLLGSI